jgi:hypothetical protein
LYQFEITVILWCVVFDIASTQKLLLEEYNASLFAGSVEAVQSIVNSSSLQNIERKSLQHDTSGDVFKRSSRPAQEDVEVLEMFDTSVKDYTAYRYLCSDPDIDVFYINGIDNTLEQNTGAVTALAQRLNYLKFDFNLKITFYGIHNPTEGKVIDLLECIDLVSQQSFNIGPGMVLSFN